MKDLDVDLPSEQLGLRPGNRRSFFFRIKSDIEDSGKYMSGMNNIQFFNNMNGKSKSLRLDDPIKIC